MDELASSMEGDSTRIPFKLAKPPPAVAYTYFGQFIVHDLTFDDTPLGNNPLPDPHDILNHSMPFLDLDSLYGDGPFSQHSPLYEEHDRPCFKIGSAETAAGQKFDVPLDGNGNALLADKRNNENVVLRQIHAMFLKLHNMAVEDLRGHASDDSLFDKARQRVRWQFQWMVRHDYLPAVCKFSVYEDIVVRGNCRIEWDNCFAIPMEFAHAAARFGHSMVRPEYVINPDRRDVKVQELFEAVRQLGPLHRTWAVDWDGFTKDSNGANSIDTTVVKALFKLPQESRNLFVSASSPIETPKLPLRTLYRGIMMHLAPGQDVQLALDPGATLPQVPNGFPEYKPYEPLEKLGLRNKIPLWYYVLLEAELEPQWGSTLGPVGTRIIAEVVEGSLRADPDSFLHQRSYTPDWRPPAWRVGNEEKYIDNLYDLAVVVGLAGKHRLGT